MIVTELQIPGAFVFVPEPIADERGSFARVFDVSTLEERGLQTHFPEWSVSRNARVGTLRGMHYSVGAGAETKLVRVTRGRAYDVLLDLRSGSPAWLRSVHVILDCAEGNSVYIPPGVAHGFQTLSDDTDVLYQITPPYVPDVARGVRWDDPAFSIAWPDAQARIISARDRSYPDHGG